MEKNEYFQKALLNFTHDMASGGGIRQLTDRGYPAKQIRENLSFPVPLEEIKEVAWKRLLETKVILTQEPGQGTPTEKVTYVKKQDAYGRTSFQRVVIEQPGEDVIMWKKRMISSKNFRNKLWEYQKNNKEEKSYAKLSYNKHIKPAVEQKLLNQRQEDYVTGLAWKEKTIHHKLDFRMAEIVTILVEAGIYDGKLYFLETGEQVWIEY